MDNQLTPDEEQAIAEYVRKLNAFSTGESHACPNCGQEVASAILYEKWEPEMFSLYVNPCGHRLGLWGKAPDWITNVTVIPVQDDSEEYDEGNEERETSLSWREYLIRRYGTEGPNSIKDYWQE